MLETDKTVTVEFHLWKWTAVITHRTIEQSTLMTDACRTCWTEDSELLSMKVTSRMTNEHLAHAWLWMKDRSLTCLFLLVFVCSFRWLSNYRVDWSLLRPIDNWRDRVNEALPDNVDIADADRSAISTCRERISISFIEGILLECKDNSTVSSNVDKDAHREAFPCR